jgi:hypothetical protein
MVEQSNRISGFTVWMDDGPNGIEAFAYRFYVLGHPCCHGTMKDSVVEVLRLLLCH